MQGKGIFGVEMFLTPKGELLINEISPRTHNSGHYTTEACQTSQFVQQLNILSGKPLGSTDQLQPAVMFNLLGAEGLMATPWWKALIRRKMIRPCGCICTGKPAVFPVAKWGM